MAPTRRSGDPVTHRYRASVTWHGSTGVGYDRYDRAHEARAEPADPTLALASDPAFGGDPDRLNPEQLLVLAASSCQLLSFLAVAARARLDVVAYRDEATAVMPEDDPPTRLTRIELRPHISVVPAPGTDPATVRATVERLVAVGHRECYIANSLRTTIVIEPVIVLVDAGPHPS